MNDKLSAIINTYQAAKDNIQTEEATKNALIMPFIAAMGYNVFNPMEVIPEMVADIGIKKGEKIDYAIKINNEVAMLIECKNCGTRLDHKKVSQLYRYFHVSQAHVGILTNGLEYQFFTDLDEQNKMDASPFFTFNLLNFDDAQFTELQRFTKSQFNMEAIFSRADEIKRGSTVKCLLESYISDPNENFIKCVLADIQFQNHKTQQVVASYAQIVKDAFTQLIKDRVATVLRDALKQNQQGEGVDDGLVTPSKANDATELTLPPNGRDDGIVTTPEEIEGYAAVKGIAREVIPAGRVHMRDAKSYCAILLDNKNNKPIVRLYFNNLANKKLNIFGAPPDKKGEMVPVAEVDEIYQYADRIIARIQALDAQQNLPDDKNDNIIGDDVKSDTDSNDS
ncbi:MAG: type I restriction enzyme HsdR N-terminal domain-containing protein [Deltaproteobacteria bacterium]|nr:type I restriction enzyme HsdR N-terminal domain-containing protein [Deltaproteobacteria bacterium]